MISLDEFPVDPALLAQALTHKSAGTGADNERLEFLGDAALEIIVTEHLYHAFPDYTEGQLTSARIAAVSEPTLAEAARRLGLGERLILSEGERRAQGRQRPSILSDAFEAVVAAIYLSLGMDAARRFVLGQLGEALGRMHERDYKTQLQELTQRRYRSTPTWRIVEESGPPHHRSFRAEAMLDGRVVGAGEGLSKKSAEQVAARQALHALANG